MPGILSEILSLPSETSKYARSPRNWTEGSGEYRGILQDGRIVYPVLQKLQQQIQGVLSGPPTNLVANTNAYIDPNVKFTGTNDLPEGVGGQYSPLGGIQIGAANEWSDPLGALIHEQEHLRAFSRKPDGRNAYMDPNQANAMDYDLHTWSENHRSMIDRYRLSGQSDINEILPEFVRYEAGLPAGMTFAQSPLGKEILTNPARQVWWNSNVYSRGKEAGQ